MKLRQLQSILEIADAKQEIDRGIHNWIAETREVAYGIEDLLLVVLSPSSSSSASRRRYTGLFREATSLHSLEPKIQLIEAKVSSLESDLRVRNIRPHQRRSPNLVARRRLQQRRTYSHFVEDDLVGIDDHVKQLASRLVSEDARILVIYCWNLREEDANYFEEHEIHLLPRTPRVRSLCLIYFVW